MADKRTSDPASPASRTVRLALCRAPLTVDGKTPEWVELVPPGPEVKAVDGRVFQNTKPEQIVAAFKAYGLDLPVDYEHATELRAPKGEEAPAAGWLTALELRSGGVWGRVEWTAKGEASLAGREYRFLSPAFLREKDTSQITELVSVGLTNKPALTQLAALAREETAEAQPSAQQESDMKELLKALGLDEKATEAQALSVLSALKEQAAKAVETASQLTTAKAELARAQVPDLARFVPRADLDAALARAQTAEKTLTDERAGQAKAAAEAEVADAVKAGKIPPASKDFYLSTCSSQEGLTKFREFIKGQPSIIQPSGLDGKAAPGTGGDTLSSVELEVCSKMGLTHKAFLDARRAQQSR